MDSIQIELLKQVADIHQVPEGAYSLRINGNLHGKNSTSNIDIVKKEDKPGIDIYVKAGTKNESVHIPVLLSQTGLKELVYNDFHIGEDCDIVIVAGCGIHNAGSETSEHSGVHAFYLAKGARLKYIEKHYGSGDGNGQTVMNPTTYIEMESNSYMEMETTQIKGVDSTDRKTTAILGDGTTLIVREKIMTHGEQFARTEFDVSMNGENSGTHVISRSVARENSRQTFVSRINGNNVCSGHTECDAIIMDSAKVEAVPEIAANHPEASLIHEAAIGKIAGEQLIKLMSLGLTEKEAEEEIVSGFLK